MLQLDIDMVMEAQLSKKSQKTLLPVDGRAKAGTNIDQDLNVKTSMLLLGEIHMDYGRI